MELEFSWNGDSTPSLAGGTPTQSLRELMVAQEVKPPRAARYLYRYSIIDKILLAQSQNVPDQVTNYLRWSLHRFRTPAVFLLYRCLSGGRSRIETQIAQVQLLDDGDEMQRGADGIECLAIGNMQMHARTELSLVLVKSGDVVGLTKDYAGKIESPHASPQLTGIDPWAPMSSKASGPRPSDTLVPL